MRFLPAPGAIGPSLYETLKARGSGPARGLQRLRAALLPDADAAWLGTPKGSPTLYIQRIAYLADGRGVEFTRSYYRADTYDFVSELTLAPKPKIGTSSLSPGASADARQASMPALAVPSMSNVHLF